MHQVILTVILLTLWNIWKVRNMSVFDGVQLPTRDCIVRIKKMVNKLSFLFKGNIYNLVHKLYFLKMFKANPIVRGSVRQHEVLWAAPQPSWHKVNFDGAATGNPGRPYYCAIFQNYRGFSRGYFAIPLGINNAFYVELIRFIFAVEIANYKGWFPLWLESNFVVLVYKVHCSMKNQKQVEKLPIYT